MRKIIVASFLTMDGVLQAPGGPEEDRTNGFNWGGWMVEYTDDISNNALATIMSSPFDLLLGRRTYEIFAAHWPYQHDEIAEKFNRINKYVVATTPIDTSWTNSILINSDVINELTKLKEQDGPHLLVHGSSGLVQTLFANDLVDALHTWTFPITLGVGKKLFKEGTRSREWRLTSSEVSTKGVLISSYVPGGKVKVGSFVPENPSRAEIQRRTKWKADEENVKIP